MTTTLAIHHTSDHDDAFALELDGQPADLVTVLLVPDRPAGIEELEQRLAELIASQPAKSFCSSGVRIGFARRRGVAVGAAGC